MNVPLFSAEPQFPEGFFYHPDFLTEEEEMKLFAEISKIELQSFYFQGFKANRKTASFGYDYSFEKNNLSKGKDIPAAFHFIIQKVAAKLFLTQYEFAELLVTEYPAGAVINWHRDAPPFNIIAGISLLADRIFRLRPYNKLKK